MENKKKSYSAFGLHIKVLFIMQRAKNEKSDLSPALI